MARIRGMSDEEHIEEYEFLRMFNAGNPACFITDYDEYAAACKRYRLTPLPEEEAEAPRKRRGLTPFPQEEAA